MRQPAIGVDPCHRCPVMRQPAFGVERRHAAGAGGRDRLAVVVVGHVAGGEHAFDAGVGAERHGPLDVLLGGQLELAFEKRRCWACGRSPGTCPPRRSSCASSVDRAVQSGRRSRRRCRRPALRRARGSRRSRSWSCHRRAAAMIFDARSSSRRWTRYTLAGELGQVGRLFDGRVAAADDHQRLVAEARQVPRRTRRRR